MKIKRFTAKNMREAMRLVREEQGPDAVILSNRRSSDGIEVVAAVDYDAALMQQAIKHEPLATQSVRAAPALPANPGTGKNARVQQAPSLPATPFRSTPIRTAEQARAVASGVAQQVAQDKAAPAAAVQPAAEHGLSDMRRELSGMRKMMETQLGSLVWDNLSTRQPKRAAVLRALTSLAVAPGLAREIAAEMPEQASEEKTRLLPLALLSRRVPVAQKEILMEGGVIALIGATGVGKTTTVAKLAARYGARHGLRDVALVSTDTYRVGAQEQLYSYGRLLGVTVHTAANAEELKQILAKLADHKLVLIDTAGLSPRDRQLTAALGTLSATGIRKLLVLPASSQAGDLDQTVRHFSTQKLDACVLTKLDEATRIGGALSVCIKHQLPVAYTCDGQRVPEDLSPARADHLVLHAQQLSRLAPASLDDAALALQFGTHAHVRA